ncbi:MAG: P-loop NTPase [Lachnospiraceae bacterium]|nr:P-loop NTPase [Lachnospiraceae bacterium]MDD6192387.1 P-loop NTPase [Lachnospiraceae bacterium]
MGEIIMITSGKGGVGKTTATALMGVQLSRLDKRVVMIDMDFGLRNLDLQFCMDERIRYNIADVLQGVCAPKQTYLRIGANLDMIPGSKSYDFAISEYALGKLMSQLRRQFDYVLIDTPAGITNIHQKLLPFVDDAIIITTWDKASLSDAVSMCRFLHTRDIQTYLILNELNKISTNRFMTKEILVFCDKYLNCEYLGRLPFQKNFMYVDTSKKIRNIADICSKIEKEE